MVQSADRTSVVEGDELLKEDETYYQIKREGARQWRCPSIHNDERRTCALNIINWPHSHRTCKKCMCRCSIISDLYFKNILNYARRNSNSFIKRRKTGRLLSGFGSVAVGKSTTARLMQRCYNNWAILSNKRVFLMTNRRILITDSGAD